MNILQNFLERKFCPQKTHRLSLLDGGAEPALPYSCRPRSDGLCRDRNNVRKRAGQVGCTISLRCWEIEAYNC